MVAEAELTADAAVVAAMEIDQYTAIASVVVVVYYISEYMLFTEEQRCRPKRKWRNGVTKCGDARHSTIII